MAEETLSSIEAPKPPAVNPISGTASAHAPTLKLKPVIRKPVIGGAKPAMKMPSKPAPAAAPQAAAPAAPAAAPVEQLKTITQKLKGVTQQIPQQAILHKTGIIAEQQLTDAQKMASKSRTSRISLSDAIGASPVQSEAAPMKTIRIKRPVDLNSAPTTAEKPVAPAPQGEAEATPAPAAKDVSVTQRKTLKVSRPGAVRPMGKFATKKTTAATTAAPAADKAEGEVADIPEVADMPAAAPAPVMVKPAEYTGGVPEGLAVFDTILQFAACIAIALLGTFMYVFDFTRNWF